VTVTRPVVVLAEPMYHPAGEELLRRTCEVRVLHSPARTELEQAVADAHAIAARYPQKVDEALLASAPGVVIVASSGRGTDAIDIEAATRRGVAVVNNPGFGPRPVSEAAMALMLALAKRVFASDAWMRKGEGWSYRGDLSRFLELEGKALGIVGLGAIGRETARKAIAAFNMRVLAYDPYVPAARMEALGVRKVDSLDDLLAGADIVSMHPELNAETRGMIGERELRRMKPTAYLINTARGKVVQEAALVRALRERWIAGAALDVYEDEPMGPGSPLYALDNIILLPHVAGLTLEAVEGMSLSAARQILQALGSECPPHILNREIWPAAAERATAAALTL
jgi:D-3-phosphoglycerate dehydrogenase/microcystin synthetase protein McyI